MTSTATPATAQGATTLTVLTACCAPATTGQVADENAVALAESFKALADPARVKILSMLLNADEVCACDISDAIGKSAATASHHLSLLRKAGLVTGRRRGTWVYYQAVPERLAAIRDTLGLGR